MFIHKKVVNPQEHKSHRPSVSGPDAICTKTVWMFARSVCYKVRICVSNSGKVHRKWLLTRQWEAELLFVWLLWPFIMHHLARRMNHTRPGAHEACWRRERSFFFPCPIIKAVSLLHINLQAYKETFTALVSVTHRDSFKWPDSQRHTFLYYAVCLITTPKTDCESHLQSESCWAGGVSL